MGARVLEISERSLSVAGSLPKGDVRGMDGNAELGDWLTIDWVPEL